MIFNGCFNGTSMGWWWWENNGCRHCANMTCWKMTRFFGTKIDFWDPWQETAKVVGNHDKKRQKSKVATKRAMGKVWEWLPWERYRRSIEKVQEKMTWAKREIPEYSRAIEYIQAFGTPYQAFSLQWWIVGCQNHHKIPQEFQVKQSSTWHWLQP